MPQYISPSDSRYWNSNPNKEELPEGAVVGTPPASGVIYNDDGTREARPAPEKSAADEYYESLYRSPEDVAAKEAETREDFNKRLQDQINAIEEAYAPIYQQASREAEGRLGSTATINALSGQRGAPSGAANTEKTASYNTQIRQSIDSRKSAEIAVIRGKYDDQLADELKYQEKLRREDADKYIQYMAGKEDREKEIKKNRLDDILSTNVAFDELDQDLQDEYATLFGYTLGEARRSWDHKVATQLLDKEKADKTQSQADQQFAWQKEDRDKADIAVENELRSQGWEYIKNKDELLKVDTSQYDVIAIKQSGGAPDKLYKVPKGMSELEIYEAKKAIDAKYNTSDSNTSKVDKSFYTAVQKEVANLQKGEAWETVWERIKQQFPDKIDDEIDTALGMEWKEPGAYEKFKAKQYKQGTPSDEDTEAATWAWLATDEANDMSNAEKKKEIMSVGLNPADFGIY